MPENRPPEHAPAVGDFLARMQAELPAPTHLRANAKARDTFLADYERVLSGWSKEVLDAAWPVVLSRLEFWIWPRPQEIHDACKEVARRVQPAGEFAKQHEEAQQQADRFVKHYRSHSAVVKLADREGWTQPLMTFVRESAWVQAQILCKVRHIGWDTKIAKHLGRFRTSQEAFDAYRQSISGALQRGRIEVRVPKTLIQEWKEQGRIHESDSNTRNPGPA
jgi:hypothetical protein